MIINTIILLLSIPICIFGFYKLITQSIIQYSTRIFLIMSLVFIIDHQIALITVRIQTFVLLYSGVCEIQVSECLFMFQGTIIGNAGLSLIQLSMSLDRILNSIFKDIYFTYRHVFGPIFSLLTIFASIEVYKYILLKNPLTEFIVTCESLPTETFERYDFIITCTLYLSIIDIFVDLIVLRLSIIHERNMRKFYSVQKRYEANASLKCTQTVMTISSIQFLSQMFYSAMYLIMMYFFVDYTSISFILLNLLGYPVVYTNTLHACLIIYSVNRIKKQRKQGIENMKNQRLSMDEHMNKLKTAWG
ncbi:unnamed protein product [Caenorhabditis angaria]|uniref:Uncharacterized protein n=1 Tax=Caenorhabditis angaria TaxID=860376 RepID=A0A9P1N020_9PELO|nr:unnamed protein product [Caenorhabditis angaria]